MDLVLACVASFVAGLVDAMAGGGGLIQLPALMALLPHESMATVLGTNKGAAIFGTTVALQRYVREVKLPWRSVAGAAAAAFVASAGGAMVARTVDASVFKPAVLVVLVAVAAFTFFRPQYGAVGEGRERPSLALLLGAAIGFYDGLIGPGTGTFLIFVFIATLGLDFLKASAAAKAVNVGTNLAAVLIFAASGHVKWEWSLPMAVANMAGAFLGAKLALGNGAGFVRRVFQVVIVLLIAKVGFDVWSAAIVTTREAPAIPLGDRPPAM